MKSAIRRRRRTCALFYLFLLLTFPLGLKLFNVQILHAHQLRILATEEHQGKIPISSYRGSILDRTGQPLAFSIPGFSIAANPEKVKKPEEAVKILSPLLNCKREDLLESLTSSSSFVWLARKVEEEAARKVKSLDLQGIQVIRETTGKRIYPNGVLAGHLLGYTGVDDQGLDGLELAYDSFLKGRTSYFTIRVDGLGRVIPYDEIQAPPPQFHIQTTIQESIQYVAERELARSVKEHQAHGGTIIVLDPKTGEILACAVAPAFSGDHYEAYPDPLRRNAAISNAYEPGSTFKVILAAAALDSGAVTPTETFFAGSSTIVGGWVIRNANDGLSSPTGRETLEGILTYSFNVGAVSVALKVGEERFASYLKRLRFGVPTGIDLPGEAGGKIPTDEEWAPIVLATSSFGQGVAVTPIQMAQAFGAIANGGVLVTPHLLKSVLNENGSVVFTPKRNSSRVLKEDTARKLVNILQKVVEDGTGKRAQLQGYGVAGKTGTAQISVAGGYSGSAYIASFIGLVPAENPSLVILVKIDEPKDMPWGGVVAAPVFKAVAHEAVWALGIPPTRKVTGVNGENLPQ